MKKPFPDGFFIHFLYVNAHFLSDFAIKLMKTLSISIKNALFDELSYLESKKKGKNFFNFF